MTDYVDLGIETDPETLLERARDRMRAQFPGWEPSDAQLDSWILDVVADFGAMLASLAVRAAAAIYERHGLVVYGVAPVAAARASTSVTFTMADGAGYTVPAGTKVAIGDGAGGTVAFELLEALTVTAPATTGVGVVYALEAGADHNGLDPAVDGVQMLSGVSYVAGVAASAVTSGGADAEDPDTYRDRLVGELQAVGRPVLPDDFAIKARRVPGVARAMVRNLYVGTGSLATETERAVSLACFDEDGNGVSSGVRGEVEALLQAEREVNFVVAVLDPTVTAVDVTWTAVARRGYEASAVESAGDAALSSYLSGASWTAPEGEGERNTGYEFLIRDTVRRFELVHVLESVPGIDYVQTLTLALDGDTLGTADLTLPGAIPIPSAGTLSATVTAAS